MNIRNMLIKFINHW